MVVALCTGDVGPEKSRQRVGKAVQRHTGIAQEVRGGTIRS